MGYIHQVENFLGKYLLPLKWTSRRLITFLGFEESKRDASHYTLGHISFQMNRTIAAVIDGLLGEIPNDTFRCLSSDLEPELILSEDHRNNWFI